MVVVVLGVLAGVVVAAGRGSGDKGRSAAYASDARTLRSAEEAFFGTRNFYATEAELVAAGFLSEESSLHEVELEDPPLAYRITCRIAPGCGGGGAVVRGGVLTASVTDIGAGGGILNPAVTTDDAVHANSEPMFNGLVSWTDDRGPVAELADRWETDEAAHTTTFTLRAGMTWHDGSPITAADVKFTFDAALLRYHARTSASLGPALGVVANADPDLTLVPAGAITLPDGESGLRVRFNFGAPYPFLLRQLDVTEAPILPRAVFGPCAAAGTLDDTETDPSAQPPTSICPANLAPVGSGPFRYAGVDDRAGALRMIANPNYFRRGLPFLEGLTLRALPRDVLTAALIGPRSDAASVDLVRGVPGADITGGARLAENSAIVLGSSFRVPGGANCMVSLAFNLWAPGTTPESIAARPATAAYEHPVLANSAVRRAVAMGFNRQRALDEIEFGQGALASSPYHQALVPAHAAQGLPPHDPVGARNALEAAGWIDPSSGTDLTTTRRSDGRSGLPPAGTPLTLTNRHLASGAQVDYAAALAEDLRQVGVEVNLEPDVDPSSAIFVERRFDTAWVTYCHGPDPALGVRRQYHSDSIATANFTNASGYRNPTMDAWWDEVGPLPSPAPRYRDLHLRIQQRAAADLPYIWVTETVRVSGWRALCRGLEPSTGLYAERAWCLGE